MTERALQLLADQYDVMYWAVTGAWVGSRRMPLLRPDQSEEV